MSAAHKHLGAAGSFESIGLGPVMAPVADRVQPGSAWREQQHVQPTAVVQQSSVQAAAVDLTAGTFAGIAQLIVGHPFDTIKVRTRTLSILDAVGHSTQCRGRIVPWLSSCHCTAGRVCNSLGIQSQQFLCCTMLHHAGQAAEPELCCRSSYLQRALGCSQAGAVHAWLQLPCS